jgi:hypothetical protein
MRKLLILGLLLASQATAAILSVTGEYTVTEQVRSRERLGIRLRDADNGGRTQNWLWLNPDTKVCVRHFQGNGTFWDEVVSYEKAWRVLTPGTQFRVAAGRDWDGTLTAHKIWTSK